MQSDALSQFDLMDDTKELLDELRDIESRRRQLEERVTASGNEKLGGEETKEAVAGESDPKLESHNGDDGLEDEYRYKLPLTCVCFIVSNCYNMHVYFRRLLERRKRRDCMERTRDVAEIAFKVSAILLLFSVALIIVWVVRESTMESEELLRAMRMKQQNQWTYDHVQVFVDLDK